MISVVIPLYNKEQSVAATLDSVLQASLCLIHDGKSEVEIIIVNDGSTDSSAQVVEQWINSSFHHSINPSFRLISQPNGGVCSARNRGIQEAKGDYIALLDGDDLWDKDYLKEMQRMIADFHDAALWGINYAEVYEGKLMHELPTGLPSGYRGYVEDYFHMKGRISDLFCSSSVVVRKEVFDKVGYFDERIKYAEDNDMWFRIIANYPVAFYDRYMAFYRHEAENRALNRPRLLKYYLPYFVDKYKEPLFKSNRNFYQWINQWSAQKIRPYYFSKEKENQQDADIAVQKLDYAMIPFKYRFLYQTPRCIGKLVDNIDRIYHGK